MVSVIVVRLKKIFSPVVKRYAAAGVAAILAALSSAAYAAPGEFSPDPAVEELARKMENLLDDVEADFWLSIYEANPAGMSHQVSGSGFSKLRDKVGELNDTGRKLQGILAKKKVSIEFYNVGPHANTIHNLLQNYMKLYSMLKRRRLPDGSRQDISSETLGKIRLLKDIPYRHREYDELAGHMAAYNMELFLPRANRFCIID